MTNISDSGDYPLGEEQLDINFEREWRDWFSHFPEVATLTWEQRQYWKEFSKKIANHVNFGDRIQSMANVAYNDGYEDAKEHMRQDIDEQLNKLEEKEANSPLLEKVRQIVKDV